MKVICESYKVCRYRDTCSHSKAHDVIHLLDDERGSANNCILSHKQIDCFCSTVFLRKDKLIKLKNYEII